MQWIEQDAEVKAEAEANMKNVMPSLNLNLPQTLRQSWASFLRTSLP